MARSGDPGRKFDAYASDYDVLLADSIRASGESPRYFLDYKLDCLQRLGVGPSTRVLDFGCGTGNLTAVLCERYAAVEGFDPSPTSLRIARHRVEAARFHDDVSTIPDRTFGAAVLSGVLHHIEPARRLETLRIVHRKLAPGGRLVVFEHNPFNPLTRRAVAACPFDDDAILLWPWQLRRLVGAAGFGDVRLDFIVFFPGFLARLRWLEPRLRWLGLGAQTMTSACRA